jgi:hypothetical protein
MTTSVRGAKTMVDVNSRGMRMMGPVRIACLALVAGAGVGVAAFLTARYGPVGRSWSFRGNGALAVYSAVPALLAMAWTAAVLRHRAGAQWVRGTVAAGIVGLMLAFADAVLLPLFGIGADQAVGPLVLLALVAWTFIAPILALVAPAGRPVSLAAAAFDAAASALGLLVGVAAMSLALPAGS